MRSVHLSLLAFVLVAASSALAEDLLRFSPAALELVLEEDLVLGVDIEGGRFGQVVDVALDSSENIYVLDRGFNSIHKFTPDGEYLFSFGREGEGPGDLRQPSSMAFGSNDLLYVAGGSIYVDVFDTDGNPIDSHKRLRDTATHNVQSCAVDAEGHVYLASVNIWDQKIIAKYSPRGFKHLFSFCNTFTGQDRSVDLRRENIYGGGNIDISPHGEIFYLQSVPPVFRVYDTSGAQLQEYPTRGSQVLVPVPVVEGESVYYSSPEMAGEKIVALEYGALVSIIVPDLDFGEAVESLRAETFLDLYDRSGHVLKSTVRAWPFRPLCADSSGRVYVMHNRTVGNGEMPAVTRYMVGE